MVEKAFVFSIENNKIIASRFHQKGCTSCGEGCAKKNCTFEILNPLNLDIKSGSVVLIGANKKKQALQGIISLFIPFVCAILGYIFAPQIMSLFGKTISSDAKAIFVLLFLALSSLLIFVLTRKFPIPGKPEILEVL